MRRTVSVSACAETTDQVFDLFTSATILMVPGLRDAMPEHWQSLLEADIPGARSVPPMEVNGLNCAARVGALDAAVAAIEGPVILVAHSAGVLMVAHWALKHRSNVVAALLVTPPDLAAPWPEKYPRPETLRMQGWSPLPCQRLPFPSLVVASSNDHLASPDAVRAMASAWGSELLELGAVGHMNPASGFGPWPQALELIAQLHSRAAPVVK
ncbi:MAG: alpha/beta hydrolase [Pseudomonadota bacterium]